MCLLDMTQYAPSVGFSRDHGQLGHGRLAIGEDELGSVSDDAAPFLLRAGKEAGNVLQGDERDVEGVAEADETGALDRGIDVENTRHVEGLVRDDTHDVPVQARESDDDILGPQGLHLEERAVIDDEVDDLVDVVRLPGIVGNDIGELRLFPAGFVARRRVRRILEVVLREV